MYFDKSIIKKKDYVHIEYECAKIFFNNKIEFDPELCYIETSSYVIYPEEDKVIALSKLPPFQRSVVISDIGHAFDMFKMRKISAYQDFLFYVKGYDIYYLDLDDSKEHLIFSIEKKSKPYDLCDIKIFRGEKLIYYIDNYYIVDLKDGPSSEKRFSNMNGPFITVNKDKNGQISYRTDVKGNYFIHDDEIIYLGTAVTKEYSLIYCLLSCNVYTGEITEISKPFQGERWGSSDITTVAHEGVFGSSGDFYFVVFGKTGILDFTHKAVGYYCLLPKYGNKEVDLKKFNLHGNNISQISSYNGNLVYMDGISLTEYIINIKSRNVLVKAYGTKLEPSRGLFKLPKAINERPEEYMSLGRFKWIKDNSQNGYKVFI